MRFLALAALCALSACGRGGPMYASASPVSPAAGAGAAAGAAIATGVPSLMPEQLVIEGTLTVRVDEIGDVVPALRALVEGAGGRIINEVVTGAERSWMAQLKVRVPPSRVEEVAGFLAKRGQIDEKRITSSDVSKQLFDQEIALKNLHTTMERLNALMAQGGLKVAEILQIEQEMTRLRGQIEAIEGEQRFLKDRVAYATLDIGLTRRAGAVVVAQAKLYPGVRFASLVLLDPRGRARIRSGAGVVVHSLLRSHSIEVDVFQKKPDAAGEETSNAMLLTTGGAAYSDFLGSGRRRTLNPYVGGRIGYGYLDAHNLVLQGEVGVELFKARNIIVDANARMTALLGKDSDLGVVLGGGATFAF
ncbi:MAG: DUF4349 domain-containing protein [Deltaproteobacteria bacterium]|nr:DUF4349 domain-containing protein [Deltaproteobacteria bacterium]